MRSTMNHPTMKLLALGAALLLTGCAAIATGSHAPTSGVALTVGMQSGQSVQALLSEVASASLRVEVGNFSKTVSREAPVTQEPNQHSQWFFDLKDLPEGPAKISVEVFNSSNAVMGRGMTSTFLQLGRRNHAQVSVLLSSEGRTDFRPLTPLGDLYQPGVSPGTPLDAGTMRLLYNPFRPGMKWTYAMTSQTNGIATMTATMSHEVVAVDGQEFVIVRSGTFLQEGVEQSIPTATATGSILNPGDVSPSYVPTYQGVEAVVTPYQTFSKATKVEVQYHPATGVDATQQLWLVPELGIVRMVESARDSGGAELYVNDLRLIDYDEP